MKLYNGTVEIVLDETNGKHQYAVTDSVKGLKNATMRGVSDIKRQILAKPGLMHWSKDVALQYIKDNCKSKPSDEELEKASKAYTIKSDYGKDVGTEVHAAIERYLTGNVNTGVSSDGEKAYMAFVKWFENTDLKTVAVEQPVYSRERGYCGKFDAILELDGKNVLVDFKTTNISPYALKKGKEWTGLYPEDFMQLGFYSKAYRESVGYSMRVYEALNGTTLKEDVKERKNVIQDIMLINCTKDGKLITLSASEIGWKVEDCENLAMNALSIADGLRSIKKGALDMELWK